MTRKGRDLTEAEKALWRRITQTVDPLTPDKERGESPPPSPPLPMRFAGRPRPRLALEPQTPLPSLLSPAVTRQIKRVRKIKAEARLDLHGMTRDQARLRLLRFLEACQDRGYVWVLVITGKGRREGGTPLRGVLQGLVPQWLEETAVRALVSGYATAKAHDGGEGALYVRIKRKKPVPACLL